MEARLPTPVPIAVVMAWYRSKLRLKSIFLPEWMMVRGYEFPVRAKSARKAERQEIATVLFESVSTRYLNATMIT